MIKRKSILLMALCIVFMVFALGSGSGESTRDSVKVDSDKKSEIKYEISDTGFEYYTNSLDMVEYYGYVELTNTGDCDIYLDDCKFDLEDNEGHLLQSDSFISSCPKVISPGEKGYFYNGVGSTYIDKSISFENGIKLVPQMKLKKATKKPASYPVSDISVSESDFGSIKVTGRVENTSDKAIGYLYLNIIFCGSDGKVLAITGTSVTDIGAGMKCSFDTSTLLANDNLKLEDISDTKVIAEESYLQW